MKHIILEAMNTEAVVFDVGKLAAHLGQLPDSRDRRGEILSLIHISQPTRPDSIMLRPFSLEKKKNKINNVPSHLCMLYLTQQGNSYTTHQSHGIQTHRTVSV